MTLHVTATIRKIMGWCPQRKIISSAGGMFISGYANCSKNRAFDDNQFAESIEIPIQSRFEWRVLSILLGFIALVLIGSEKAGTYGYVLPSFFIYIVLVFILGRSKLSVGNEALKLSVPLSRDILIHKNNVNGVEIIENSAGRHRLRNLALLILMSMQIVFLLFTLKGQIWTNTFIISIFLWVYVLYFSIRIYNNTKIVKINAEGSDIILYPRNEHELLILKEFAKSKPI